MLLAWDPKDLASAWVPKDLASAWDPKDLASAWEKSSALLPDAITPRLQDLCLDDVLISDAFDRMLGSMAHSGP